jgi:hypothetical protein
VGIEVKEKRKHHALLFQFYPRLGFSGPACVLFPENSSTECSEFLIFPHSLFCHSSTRDLFLSAAVKRTDLYFRLNPVFSPREFQSLLILSKLSALRSEYKGTIKSSNLPISPFSDDYHTKIWAIIHCHV